jgi:hypothetical protein
MKPPPTDGEDESTGALARENGATTTWLKPTRPAVQLVRAKCGCRLGTLYPLKGVVTLV